jgi:hypothetical protein
MKILVEMETEAPSVDYYCDGCTFLQVDEQLCGKCKVNSEDIVYYDGWHRCRQCYLWEFHSKELEILREIEENTRNLEVLVYTDPHTYNSKSTVARDLREKLERLRAEKDFNAFDDVDSEYDFSGCSGVRGRFSTMKGNDDNGEVAGSR